MTTTANGRQIISACNGVTVAFSCPQFRKNAELQVWLLDSASQKPETGTRLTEGANYTITGSPIAGTAMVNTLAVYAAGKFLCRKRVTSRAQNVDVVPNQGVPAATQEDALDRLSMVDEEQDDSLTDIFSRALQVPPGELAAVIPAVAARANGFLAFDMLGNPIPSTGTGADAGLRGDLALFSGTSLLAFQTGTGAGMLALNLQTALRLGLPLMLEHFGGAGDNGVTDNYDAYKKLAAYVNLQGGGRVALAPLKTYYIGRYVGDGLGTAANDLMFDGLSGFVFEGNGGKIDLNGNFNRGVTATQPLAGIKVRNSSRVSIRNVEIDGNVDVMTKAGGVAEPSAHALYIVGCTDVELVNIEPHHHAGDGLKVDGYFNGVSGKASRRLFAANVNCHHNARNNLSIVQLRDATFVGLRTTDAAMAAGTYGGHPPKLGVDVEPNYTTASAAPNTMDVNTGNITFLNPVAANNANNIFSCANPVSIDNIRIINPDWAAQAGGSTAVNAVYFDVAGGVIEGGQIDCQNQALGLTFTDNAALTDVELRGVTIRGKLDLLHCTHLAAAAKVRGCRFICTATAPLPLGGTKAWLFKLNCANLTFEDNTLWVPKEAYANEGAGDYHQIVQTGTAKRFARNEYSTDLPANQSGAATAHFANAFVDANTSPVLDDRYSGTAPGSADTFRAQPSGTHPTTDPYNRNHKNANLTGSVRPGDAAYTFVATKSPTLVIYDVPITAARAVALDTTVGRVFKGARAKVVRTAAATGAFAVNVGTGPLKALAAAGSWVECEYDGAAWVEIAAGTL